MLCMQLEAQENNNSDFFYYHRGRIIELNSNSNRVLLVSEREPDSINLMTDNMKFIKTQEYRFNDYVCHRVSPQKAKSLFLSTIEHNCNSPRDAANSIDILDSRIGIVQVTPSFQKNGDYFDVTNRFFVKLKSLRDTVVIKRMANIHSLEFIGYNKYMPLWCTLACTKDSKLNSIDAANFFYETNFFAAAEPEFLNATRLSSDDPYYTMQWGLKNVGQNDGIYGMDINIEGAWDITKGSDSIVVAVFDQGIDINHHDLNVAAYYDVLYDENYPTWYGSHGTLCAGIIGALHNDIGIKGVAPNTKLISINHSFNIDQDYSENVANGFNWAWKEGNADIINCSWCLLTSSEVVENAIDSLLTRGRNGKGCIVTFSSGNDDYHIVNYPGDSHPDILVVGAISNNGYRYSDEYDWGSNYGTGLDVMAPGMKIMTTTLHNQYYEDSGTSFACPHASGLAALILSINPELTNVEVNDIIESTSRKIHSDSYIYSSVADRPNGTWNNEMGYGLIDATAAVRAASTYDCSGVHISNQIMNTSDTLHYCNVVMDNILITDSATISIKKSQKIILNSNIKVHKGSRLQISNL